LNALPANPRRGPRQQFELSIGRVPLRLQMSDSQLFIAASERYSAFSDSTARPVTIALNDGADRESVLPEFGYEFEGAVLRAPARG